MVKRVLIVRHPDDPFARMAYCVHLLADEWRKRGLTVDVTTEPRGPVDPEVLVIPHLDLTLTPRAYRDYFARCPHVLNRGVCDISKRRISRNLITNPDQHDGAVIVKTNRNAGGAPEVDRAHKKGGVRRALLNAARKLPWSVTGLVGPLEYKVFDHPRLVPRAVWHNRRLVVEKFLPERQGELYCLRQYTFLGSRELNTLVGSPEPLVKAASVVRREVLGETPDELRRLRREMGFDYGKFDYVLHDGRVILFDANRTPTYNRNSKAGSASPLLAALAAGIEPYLDGGGPDEALRVARPVTPAVAAAAACA